MAQFDDFNANELATLTATYQYIRVSNLIVFGNDNKGLDLSELRIKFAVKRSDTMTPNVADIRVYNLADETAKKIRKEFNQVIFQAGYPGNIGVIFKGNIKQVIIGRESATDTFIDIVAGDGDRAFNFTTLNTTLAKGSSAQDQINSVIDAMKKKGVSAGYISEMPTEKLPRGKVLYGAAKNYLRNIAQDANKSWSIQDEKINFIPIQSYLPGQIVTLTSKTGMIGTPQQTNIGVNVKCLLNPRIAVGTRIKIDNDSIQRFKIDLSVPNSAANIPAPLTADGTYYVMVAEHQGDTRGVDWYTTLICINMNVTTNPLNTVQVGYN